MKEIIMTSSYTVEGYRIANYIDFISVEVVLGTGIFSEFKAGFSDFFGVRSEAFQSKLAKAKSIAFKELKEKAIKLNGDAIISIDLDYINFTENLIGLVVNGTAVSLKEDIESYEIIEMKDEQNIVDINCPLYIKSKIIKKHLLRSKIENVYVQFKLLNPKLININAIKFKINLTTFFKETINPSDQVKINTDIKQIEEQVIQLQLDQCQFDLISHIEVIIEKISIIDCEDWISNGNLVNPNIPTNEISVYQNYFGIDSICFPVIENDNWVCICGKSNNINELKCSNCLRNKENVLISKDQILKENYKNKFQVDRKIWNRERKMHAKIIKMINDSEIKVQNRYGVFTWEIGDCDLK